MIFRKKFYGIAMMEKNANTDANEEVWFKEGLRFGCRVCGRCCTGEPGYVWVTEEEIKTLAEAVHLSPERFESNFVRRVAGKGKSLIELAGGDCVLFDHEKHRCQVYQARPLQCRTWPFWDQNVDRPNSWKKTAKFCKGCNNPDGKLYTAEEIIAQRDMEF